MDTFYTDLENAHGNSNTPLTFPTMSSLNDDIVLWYVNGSIISFINFKIET